MAGGDAVAEPALVQIARTRALLVVRTARDSRTGGALALLCTAEYMSVAVGPRYLSLSFRTRPRPYRRCRWCRSWMKGSRPMNPWHRDQSSQLHRCMWRRCAPLVVRMVRCLVRRPRTAPIPNRSRRGRLRHHGSIRHACTYIEQRYAGLSCLFRVMDVTARKAPVNWIRAHKACAVSLSRAPPALPRTSSSKSAQPMLSSESHN